MLNLNREIRPEDFAYDPDKIFYADRKGDEAKRQYRAELEELKRLYEIRRRPKRKQRLSVSKSARTRFHTPSRWRLKSASASPLVSSSSSSARTRTCQRERSVIQWKKEHSDFKALYDEAIRDRLDIFEDQIVTIADDGSADIKTVTKGNKTTKVLDAEVISRAKLRVEVRKAHLKAYRPERWAEQSTLNVNSSGDDPANMSMEELEKKLSELETKEGTLRAA